MSTDTARLPAPDTAYPITLPDGSTYKSAAFLKAVIDHPRIEVGEYTYANAFDPPDDWAARLAPYLYDVSPEKLVIGKFCQIADGVRFVTASANHRYDGISSFPFMMFSLDDPTERPSMPGPGPDTIIGNDVWIGDGATILPGATLGDGVIVGANSTVGGTIPPYSIVAGSPARIIRRRFSDEVIAELLRIAWWDWPPEKIASAEAEICGGNVEALAALA
ncbi:CatB-related O-acetyltransferase [Parvularcula sp. ZS-1/3]|uniref:CatB-related O-acetyltransferase n=1 Tax=Parvularcula mediterranea TaxID=2732508 RepID=A0A7Y3RLS9_9PROT|nr:CatB-related O-acetyltransferase [Parvularcula mediterranea]NNU16453.1 CatB-related O-acetyltransferase [Parvularcula mediterranea]